MREMSVTEQRYQAVLGVLSEGRAVMEVASQRGVSRRTVHRWLARYEAQGLEGLPDRSHRPARCPHQMPAEIEVRVLELERSGLQRTCSDGCATVGASGLGPPFAGRYRSVCQVRRWLGRPRDAQLGHQVFVVALGRLALEK